MNFIHSTAIVDPFTIMGDNNYIGPNCIIYKGVTIGSNNRFESNSVVGSPAEHRDYFDKEGQVLIGNRNIIREFTTINSGTNGITVLGDCCVLLRSSHVGHDATIEDHTTLSCNSIVGGHAYIMRGANLGLGSIVHQYQVIGSYSMLGMGTVVNKKTPIPPGGIYIGNPAKFLKLNEVGLQRAGIAEEFIKRETTRYLELINNAS